MTSTLEPTRGQRGEAPLTLDEPAPKVLGWLDQIGLWGNLGVTLLAPVGAVFVLLPGESPRLSFVAAGLAVVVGTADRRVDDRGRRGARRADRRARRWC